MRHIDGSDTDASGAGDDSGTDSDADSGCPDSGQVSDTGAPAAPDLDANSGNGTNACTKATKLRQEETTHHGTLQTPRHRLVA